MIVFGLILVGIGYVLRHGITLTSCVFLLGILFIIAGVTHQ